MGKGADAEVGGEEGARRVKLAEDISRSSCQLRFCFLRWKGREAYCWTWRKGSSSFVDDIISPVLVSGRPYGFCKDRGSKRCLL